MSSCEASSQAPQCGDNLLNLLRMFLDTHQLGLEQLADYSDNSATLEEWLPRKRGAARGFPGSCRPLR